MHTINMPNSATALRRAIKITLTILKREKREREKPDFCQQKSRKVGGGVRNQSKQKILIIRVIIKRTRKVKEK